MEARGTDVALELADGGEGDVVLESAEDVDGEEVIEEVEVDSP